MKRSSTEILYQNVINNRNMFQNNNRYKGTEMCPCRPESHFTCCKVMLKVVDQLLINNH